jgi:glutathione synthase/RimK-type ligase-like ATP-grasp enzyme
MRPSIWLITYDGLPQLDPDDELAAQILRERGFICAPKIWDDPKVDWSKCQFAVVRSTWDYHRKYDEFQKWLMQPVFAGKMWNPPELLQWNSRKTYLRELEAAGIDIVPTVWFDKDASEEIVQNALAASDWVDAVVKPAVGLATSGVSKVNLKDRAKEAVQKIRELAARGEAMLQPYMKAVEGTGERSLIYMNGAFSHAIRKSAFQHFAPAGRAGEKFIDPEPDEVALAERVLKTVPHQWLYARVDVVRDTEHNKPRLMELELVEPSLFMQFAPDAPKRFADAIESRIGA